MILGNSYTTKFFLRSVFIFPLKWINALSLLYQHQFLLKVTSLKLNFKKIVVGIYTSILHHPYQSQLLRILRIRSHPLIFQLFISGEAWFTGSFNILGVSIEPSLINIHYDLVSYYLLEQGCAEKSCFSTVIHRQVHWRMWEILFEWVPHCIFHELPNFILSDSHICLFSYMLADLIDRGWPLWRFEKPLNYILNFRLESENMLGRTSTSINLVILACNLLKLLHKPRNKFISWYQMPFYSEWLLMMFIK